MAIRYEKVRKPGRSTSESRTHTTSFRVRQLSLRSVLRGPQQKDDMAGTKYYLNSVAHTERADEILIF